MPSATSTSSAVPSSILIIGSGVFGLSTALALTERPRYANTTITLLDPHAVLPSSRVAHTASIDTTRIVRADYANPDYARLAIEAQLLWRTKHWGGDGRYTESGLCLTADEGQDAYLKAALENVRRLELEHEAYCVNGVNGSGKHTSQELSSAGDIAAALRAGSAAVGTGSSGYLNPASGWAHAESCMRHLRSIVEATDRVRFVVGEADRLVLDEVTNRVTGAKLKTGEVVAAEQTILAAGSWTGRLVDLRGVASARGECIGYMGLSEEEANALKNVPVLYNMGDGCFFFPPSPPASGGVHGWEIKVAQHTFGYTNPVEFDAPVGTPDNERTITTSLPAFPASGIPPSDKERLEQFLSDSLPVLKDGEWNNRRTLSRSRLCWYLDTASSDWLVCPYPLSVSSTAGAATLMSDFPSLFLATGGSGHAFKFLPVLGERVVDVLDGTDRLPEKGAGLWTRRWAWPGKAGSMRTKSESAGIAKDVKAQAEVSEEYDAEIWCRDGSRGGCIGLKLFDAYDQ